MLLDIDRAVFATEVDDLHGPACDLLWLVVHEWHKWHPDAATALAAEEFVKAVMPRTKALQEYARKCLEESANPPPAGVAAVAICAERLVDSVADLREAAVLVVEDAINEQCFLLAVAEALGHKHIVTAVDSNRLRFSHAGGKGRMAQFVEQERKRFRVHVRVAAVLDSDAARPGVPDKANSRELDRIKQIDGVNEVHMWSWREIENYVPVAVWHHHFPDRTARVEAIQTLIPQQRGHVDVKRELVGRGRMPKPLIPSQLTLTEDDFAELGSPAVEELRHVLAMIARIL